MRTIILLVLVATAGCGGTLASVKDHPTSLQVDFVDLGKYGTAEFKAVITSGNFTFFVQGEDADEFWSEFDIAVGDCTARYWITRCYINADPNPGRSVLLRTKNHLLDLTGLEGYKVEERELWSDWDLDDFESWLPVPEGMPTVGPSGGRMNENPTPSTITSPVPPSIVTAVVRLLGLE